MKEALYNWGGLNVWLFKLINGIYMPIYGDVMVFISSISGHDKFKYYFGVIVALMLYAMLMRKLRGVEISTQDKKDAIALLITLMMGYIAYAAAVGGLKTLFAFPRPFMLDEVRATMHMLVPYPAVGDYYASFPSGHAATAGFLVGALWNRFTSPVARKIGIAFVFLVCWSRLAVGMHFPADVLGGALIGIGISYVVRRYVYRMVFAIQPKQPAAPQSR